MDREDWNRRWRESGLHCHDDPSDILAAELGSLAPGRALDLGCGAGRSAIWLADLREYEHEPASYDLALVLYLHLRPRERRPILARAAGALAAGGTMLVVGHDRTNLGTGAPGPSSPEVLYTVEEIVRELPGLDVLKAERVTRRVETDDGEADAIDTLVVARKT